MLVVTDKVIKRLGICNTIVDKKGTTGVIKADPANRTLTFSSKKNGNLIFCAEKIGITEEVALSVIFCTGFMLCELYSGTVFIKTQEEVLECTTTEVKTAHISEDTVYWLTADSIMQYMHYALIKQFNISDNAKNLFDYKNNIRFTFVAKRTMNEYNYLTLNLWNMQCQFDIGKDAEEFYSYSEVKKKKQYTYVEDIKETEGMDLMHNDIFDD